jgi:Cu-Zn family superoxide dismutase
LLAFAALGAFACAPADQPVEEEPMVEETAAPEEMAVPRVAVATLTDAQGNHVGSATFTQDGDETSAVYEVAYPGATGMHGIHVHETGECTPPDFTTAGGHFNPAGAEHAAPGIEPRHAGDFGNIDLGDAGNGRLELTTGLVTVEDGPSSVVGKSVILHAGEDDGTTQPTGDAGARLACGVVASQGGDAAGAANGMDHDMEDGMDHEDHDEMGGEDSADPDTD